MACYDLPEHYLVNKKEPIDTELELEPERAVTGYEYWCNRWEPKMFGTANMVL